MNASTGGKGGRIFLFLGCGLGDATRGPIPEGEKNCGQGAARVLRRMARGAVGMSAGRNAKAVRGEGGGRRRDGPQGLRCGTGKGGGGCGWRATEAGKLLVSTVWAMTHAAWNALVHALIGNTGAPTCHSCGGVGHIKRWCPERGRMPGSRSGNGGSRGGVTASGARSRSIVTTAPRQPLRPAPSAPVYVPPAHASWSMKLPERAAVDRR